MLRDSTARSLFLSQTVSGLGDWLGLAALIVLAYQRSGSAVGSAALFAVQGGFAFAATLLLGPRLDTLDRQRGLVAFYLTGGAALLLPVLAGGLWPVLCAAAVVGALRPMTAALRNAAIGSDLPQELVGPTVSLQSSVAQGAAALGLLTGGALVLLAGAAPVLLFDAVTFAAGGVLVLGVPHGRGATGRRPRMLDGARSWVGNATARRAVLVIGCGAAVGALPEALAPAAVDGSGWLPVVLASQSAGTALGGLWLGTRPSFERPRAMSALAAIAAATLLTAAAAAASLGPWALAVCNLLFGMAFGVTIVAQAVFTKAVEPSRLGAAVSSAIAVMMLAEGLGSLALGTVAARSGVPAAYVVAGLLLAAAAAAAARSTGGVVVAGQVQPVRQP